MIRFRPLVLLLLVRRPRGRWTIQMNRHIVRSPRLPRRCQCRPRLNEHCMIIKRSRHPPKQAAQCTTATHQCTPLTSPCSNHKHNHSLKNASLPTARFMHSATKSAAVTFRKRDCRLLRLPIYPATECNSLSQPLLDVSHTVAISISHNPGHFAMGN